MHTHQTTPNNVNKDQGKTGPKAIIWYFLITLEYLTTYLFLCDTRAHVEKYVTTTATTNPHSKQTIKAKLHWESIMHIQ